MLQVLSRLTSPLPCAMSSRRGPGGRDRYVTTQVNLGEIPLLSRRPSPAVSELDDHPHRRGGGGGGGVATHHGGGSGQHLQPDQQQHERLLVLDVRDDYPPPPPSGSTMSRDIVASASATSSIYDDQLSLSPVDAATAAAPDDVARDQLVSPTPVDNRPL